MDLHTALMTAVALMAILTGLGFVFNLLLAPVRENQERLQESQHRLQENQQTTAKRLGHLEKRMDHLEQGFSSLNAKMDQLLSRIPPLSPEHTAKAPS